MNEDLINDVYMNDVCTNDICTNNVCTNDVCTNDVCMNDVCMNDGCMNESCMNDVCINKILLNDTNNSLKKEVSRKLPESIKKKILEKQLYKCANSPFFPAIGLIGYKCLLYKCGDGSFDEAGYAFDHIEEFCITKNNNITNIQALCPNCHSVKTKNFSKYKYTFTSIELEQGAGFMET
jgi:hypothetical protein